MRAFGVKPEKGVIGKEDGGTVIVRFTWKTKGGSTFKGVEDQGRF